MLVTQLFWVCEITYSGWKQIPGSICLVPPVVPISLVVSKSPSLTLLPLPFLQVLSHGYFGFCLACCPFDGRAIFLSFSASFHEQIQVSRGVRTQSLRFRLFFIFSMSIATTLSSMAHAVLVMVRPGVWEAIFGTAISVLVLDPALV